MHRMTPEPERTSQLLRGVLDVCLLAVLVDEPAYGYEMTRRLAARGLDVVEPFQQPSDGGPPRKYYRVTPRGLSALERWRQEWNQTRSAIDAVLSSKEVER
jgi:PadR family transcriptional regulator, regulatory protein PadR